MTAWKIGLVHPASGSFPSGGNVYNHKLLDCAGRCGFPLASLPCPDDALPCGNWDLLAWDSLWLDRLARIGNERIALLLHYLPSLDPALGWSEKQAVQAMEHRAVTQADLAIVTGRTVADVVRTRWPGTPVLLCEPGVSAAFLRSRRGPAGRTVRLLTVANPSPAKGHAQLLAMLQRLRHLHWHWEVVGDVGRYPDEVRRLRDGAAQAGIADRITFHGALAQEAVAALMETCDVFVSPSTFESYGMAVAEAAAAGLPVLSQRVGAAEQLIRHGETGFLPMAGDWDRFQGYLQVLLEDAAVRAAFRANLRHASVRSWDQTFADFRAACEAVLR